MIKIEEKKPPQLLCKNENNYKNEKQSCFGNYTRAISVRESVTHEIERYSIQKEENKNDGNL